MSKTTHKKPKFLKALFKLAKFLFGFAAMILICGFAAFLLHISRSVPLSPLPSADGIVVLTGKGGGRLITGANLLHSKQGERLLISGVNPAITAEKLQSLLKLDDALYTCCVDIDYEAKDTIGNGLQTANWARALGYENIILVTSAYHMPRAKVEIKAAMAGVNIIPYPVKSHPNETQPWWGGMGKWNRLIKEYGKLLASYAREPGARPNPAP